MNSIAFSFFCVLGGCFKLNLSTLILIIHSITILHIKQQECGPIANKCYLQKTLTGSREAVKMKIHHSLSISTHEFGVTPSHKTWLELHVQWKVCHSWAYNAKFLLAYWITGIFLFHVMTQELLSKEQIDLISGQSEDHFLVNIVAVLSR